MKTLIAILIASIALSGSAMAFHKAGHDKAHPGAPSGKFHLMPIVAGDTCTAPIAEPEGTDVVIHGGPKKWGFIGEEELAIVEISVDPDVVQVCFADLVARDADVQVRISFVAEEVVEP